MKKYFEINLGIPLILIGFLILGIMGAIGLSNLMEKISKKIDPREVFESCEKTGFYFYANQTIKCEIKK
jgi:hypothetical protein